MYPRRKGVHSANYQGITTPDGLLIYLLGPTVTPTNDYLLYNESHIADVLQEVTRGPITFSRKSTVIQAMQI